MECFYTKLVVLSRMRIERPPPSPRPAALETACPACPACPAYPKDRMIRSSVIFLSR